MNVVELKEIAALFASRTKMSDIEAEAFVNSMFSVIRQGLEADRQVKIRGFGTFKVIDVEARESVSVNTGERVVIESHRKVTFTPDATMKELVNKPFSLFNTIALNDGVEFDDVDIETPPETDLQEQEADGDNQTEAPAAEPEEPVAEPEAPAAEPEEPAAEPEEAAAEPEEPVEAPEEADDESQSDDVLPPKRGRKALKVVLYCLLTLVLMGASYFVGMHYGRFCAGGDCIFSHEEAASEPVAVAVDTHEKASKEVQKTDTVKPTVPDTTAENTVDTVAAMMQTAAGYADKDVRVRTGAYCIVGTDRTVTVRQGESLAALSRRELGPGMDCYVETFNGLRPDAVLKAGQTVGIPKLMHKKALRRLAK